MSDPLTPPSHLTLIQTSRVLKRAKSTVHHWMRPGGPLEAETWHGVRMVSMRRLMAHLESLRAQETPAAVVHPTDGVTVDNVNAPEPGWDA